MSSYCKCGLHHEEDDSRLCAKCQEHADLVASHERLVKACEAFMELFRNSDMSPEDESHAVAGKIGAALTQAREVKGRMT